MCGPPPVIFQSGPERASRPSVAAPISGGRRGAPPTGSAYQTCAAGADRRAGLRRCGRCGVAPLRLLNSMASGVAVNTEE